uniref:Uncharacterized protein n=1 Tax=uncultured marine virus TaxID=186617 RepID=A0A0F7LAY7_9VIRU|nr:hypothetical protein [uncultured marine virus]
MSRGPRALASESGRVVDRDHLDEVQGSEVVDVAGGRRVADAGGSSHRDERRERRERTSGRTVCRHRREQKESGRVERGPRRAGRVARRRD